MQRSRSYLALIIKPTYDCNMECAYCSVAGHDTQSMMNKKTVDVLFERVAAFADKELPVHFIWHGGEPLLMAQEFYEYVGEKTLEYKDYCFANSVQSNGTLLDDRFADIFVKYNFRFSTSLDGPAPIHNRSRQFQNHQPTFDEVMQGVRLLNGRGLDVGAVAVLNKLNIDQVDEIYHFFNEERINFRINPVLFYGRAAEKYKEVAITPKEYGKAMIQLFDLWYNDTQTNIIVDPVYTFLGNIISEKTEGCDSRRQCHLEVISIGPKAEVYPCGQFHGNEDHYLGNLHDDDFNAIMGSLVMKRLLARVPEDVKACRTCAFQPICNCGCTASAVCRRGQIMDPDYYCGGRKMIYDHIINTVQRDLQKLNAKAYTS